MRTPCLLLIVALASAPRAQACGDCNLDGAVTVVDAFEAAYLATAIPLGLAIAPWQDELYVFCDVDNDGQFSVLDALRIAQQAVGLNPMLTCPTRPAARLAPPAGVVSGNTTLTLTSYSLSGNSLGAQMSVSVDGGATYFAATPAPGGTLTGNPTGPFSPGNDTWVWDVAADVPAPTNGVLFRIEVIDSVTLEQGLAAALYDVP